MNEFRDRIVRVAEFVTNAMLASTWRETEYRLDMCRATNGAILTSTEHIRNFVVRSSAFKCLEVSNTLHGSRYTMFCFVLLSLKAAHAVFITS